MASPFAAASSVRFTRAVLLMFGTLCGASAVAQTMPDPPQVISPLQAEQDHNSVNVLNGKARVGMPRISVPGAPRLTFERIQDVTLYIKAHGSNNGLSSLESSTAHIGGDRSISFTCVDGDCGSVGGDGSELLPAAGAHPVTQGGTGTRYQFNVVSYKTTGVNPSSMWYASQVQYADGETISYTYESGTVAGSTVTFRRPITVFSNVGFYLSITYQSNNVADGGLWVSPAQVTLYNASSPTTPLARLTYSGNTITDIGGRVYQGNIANTGTSPIEVVPAQVTLPGETTPMLQQTGNTINLIGSVIRDGVTWNYSYTNPVLRLTKHEYTYDSLAVTGPDGYSATYRFDPYVSSGTEPSNRLREPIRDFVCEA